MATSKSLTICILARNEADNLRQLLPQLTFADEVLVIDDNSTDDTAAVCRQFQTKYLLHPMTDFAAQRNYALAHIKQGWIFFLDADERMSESLKSEVLSLTSTGNKEIGYTVKRIDVFQGKELRHGETGNIWITRIGYSGSGQWQGKVHEVWNIPQTQKLNGPILHYSHDSVGQLFEVIHHYAKLRAIELVEQGSYWNAWQQLAYPLSKFIYTYILKLGILDGWGGLIMSIAMSWHSFVVRWYQWTIPWQKTSWSIVLLKYLVVVPFLLLPLGQLQRIQITNSIAFNLFETVMAAAVLFGVFHFRKQIWRRFPYHELLWLSVIIILSYLWSFNSTATVAGALYVARWLLYCSFLMVSYVSLLSKQVKISVIGMMQYVGYVMLGFGWLQYLIIPDTRWLYLLGWDDHYFRMIGTLFDPNFLGLVLSLVLVFIIYHEHGISRILFSLSTLAALIVTYSRLSWVACICVLVLIGITSKKILKYWLYIAAASIIAGGLWLLVPKPGGEGVDLLRTYSIISRWQSVQAAIRIYHQYPILGIGFNNYAQFIPPTNRFGQPFHPSSPDNSFLYILVTTGLIGFGVFLWVLANVFKTGKTDWYRFSLLLILIHSLGNNSFFYPWIIMWLWLMLIANYQNS